MLLFVKRRCIETDAVLSADFKSCESKVTVIFGLCYCTLGNPAAAIVDKEVTCKLVAVVNNVGVVTP